jgi:hypothetical protein
MTVERVPERLPALDAALAAVAHLRARPVVLLHGRLGDDVGRLVYDELRTMSSTQAIDVLLTTSGGTTTSAHRLVGLLHGATPDLALLVPLRARSAGTMVCLGADELVMTAIAELGPLDPVMAGAGGQNGISVVSASDVVALVDVVRSRLGVPEDQLGTAVLDVLARHVFPLSIAQLYRYERLARTITLKHLRRHLPDATDADRERIVETLVTGYDAHDYPISRSEARALGLRVVDADAVLTDRMLAVCDAADDILAASSFDGHEIPTLVRSASPPDPSGRRLRSQP